MASSLFSMIKKIEIRASLSVEPEESSQMSIFGGNLYMCPLGLM